MENHLHHSQATKEGGDMTFVALAYGFNASFRIILDILKAIDSIVSSCPGYVG